MSKYCSKVYLSLIDELLFWQLLPIEYYVILFR